MKFFNISDSDGNCELVRAVNSEIALWLFVSFFGEEIAGKIYAVSELEDVNKVGVIEWKSEEPELYVFKDDKWTREFKQENPELPLPYETSEKYFPVNHEIWKEIDTTKVKPSYTIKFDKSGFITAVVGDGGSIESKEAVPSSDPVSQEKTNELLRLFYGLKKETQDDILDLFSLYCGAKPEDIKIENRLSKPVSSDWFEKTLYPLACAWETYDKHDLCQYNNAECGTIYRVKRFSEIEKFWGKGRARRKNIFRNGRVSVRPSFGGQ